MVFPPAPLRRRARRPGRALPALACVVLACAVLASLCACGDGDTSADRENATARRGQVRKVDEAIVREAAAKAAEEAQLTQSALQAMAAPEGIDLGPDDPPEGVEAPAGMVWVPGGTFEMGDTGEHGKPDELPLHQVHVDGFWMDTREVTNRDFQRFVEATGYRTRAERGWTAEEYIANAPPGQAPRPDQLTPSALVFSPPDHEVELDYRAWWRIIEGADWRHPEGPGSSLEGRWHHPVVQVAWEDAVAYCEWAGKRLPTEAEWECAARLDADELLDHTGRSGGRFTANLWQGDFPHANTDEDGFHTTAPVGAFPAGRLGLHDMAGNVWEWCHDLYHNRYYATLAAVAERTGRPASNPQGPAKSFDPDEPWATKRVTRGGSFLCNDCYCRGYRPSARMKTQADNALQHTGFRCVVTPEMLSGIRGR